MYEYETGIPGHASKKPWALRLQKWLRDNGAVFEAEGETTRIHPVTGVVVEVTEHNEAYEVTISVLLPETNSENYPIDVITTAFKLALLLGERLKYELDTSLEGYPRLYITASFKDPDTLVERLVQALGTLVKTVKRSS